jgi:2-oxoisovalerate dehydrogenase E1 component
MDYLKEHPEVSADVIDLRTLQPLDMDTIMESVKKTGRALVLHEDSLTGGIGGEISARITESCFEYLDAPVMRCASLDTPIPFNAELEKNFLANRYLGDVINKLTQY